MAATAQLGQDVAAAAADAAGVKRAARAEAERAKESADSRMREYVERFREQVHSGGVEGICMCGCGVLGLGCWRFAASGLGGWIACASLATQ